MAIKIETNEKFFSLLNYEMGVVEKKYLLLSDKFNPFKKYIHDAFFSYIKNSIKKFELKCNNFDLVIYGSNSTGLGIETSDLDFAIMGYEIYSSAEFLSIMDKLEGELKRITFVKESTSIKTATVPILKLTIDIKKIGELLNLDYQGLNVPSNELNVDIAINENILGGGFNQSKVVKAIQCSHFVNTLLKKFDQLKKILLLLKVLLQSKGLNKPYKGGIGSYPQILMATAFVENYPFSDPARSFYFFLKFYGIQFDNTWYQIKPLDITSLSKLNMYYEPLFIQAQDSTIAIFNPLVPEQNITQSVNRSDEIKKYFVKLLMKLFSISQEEKIDKMPIISQL